MFMENMEVGETEEKICMARKFAESIKKKIKFKYGEMEIK